MGLSQSKTNLLREFVDFICESCHKHQGEVGPLEPHRIKQGGEYSLRNIKMCCSNCHEIFSSAQRIANGTQSYSFAKKRGKYKVPLKPLESPYIE